MEIYRGKQPLFGNAMSRIAIFENGGKIKVFQKDYLADLNILGNENWKRNVCLERYNTVKNIKNKLQQLGYQPE